MGRTRQIALIVMVLALIVSMAAYEARPEVRALREARAACHDWDRQPNQARIDAFQGGDPSAARCTLANRRYIDMSSDEPSDPANWLMNGYWIWRATGEPVQEALDAATRFPRRRVLSFTHSTDAMYGGADLYRYDADGCPVLNAAEIELVRVAQPDEQTRECLDNWGLHASALHHPQ